MSYPNEKALKLLERSFNLLKKFDPLVRDALMVLGESYKKSLIDNSPTSLMELVTLHEGILYFTNYVGFFYPYFKVDNPKEKDDFLAMTFESFKKCPYWTWDGKDEESEILEESVK